MNVIEARGLAKAYGGRRVVDDFAMTVAAGDIYGFVGKNGAGKSTVMKMICGEVAPTAGEVALFGVPTGIGSVQGASGEGDQARRIGVLIEQPGLLPNLTAYQNLQAKALAWGIVDGPARCCGLWGSPVRASRRCVGSPSACASVSAWPWPCWAIPTCCC